MAYIDEVIKIRLDKQSLVDFTGYDVDNPDAYFKAHPRSKKPPFEGLWGKTRMGLIPSINKFLNVGAGNPKKTHSKAKEAKKTNDSRIIQNQWEQHLRDYCTHCIKSQGIPSAYLNECIILAVQFKPTKAKSDVNNIYVKPFIDSIVENEILQEDNYTVVRVHMEYAVVDKLDPHSEIIIFPIIKDEYGFDFVIEYVTYYIKELEEKYF